MKKLIILSTVILSSCTTYKSDNHSVKYTTNYNTLVSPPNNTARNNIEPPLPDLASSSDATEFRNPEEMSLDDVSAVVKSKTLMKKSTVVRSYVEPIRPSHTPMAGVTPFPRDHWRSPAPQIFFYGGY